MSNATVLTDRLFAHRRFRMPLVAVGTAVISLSMLLSVSPTLGAAKNGNGSNGNSSSGGTHGTSGNVKVHDVGTGVETSGTDNEPHVCSFWLGFELDAPYEAGTWVVVSWAPTGDGSSVASGVYDTAGDGVDISGVIEVPAGHYRVEWKATGATTNKKKTFWVDADCGQAAPPDEESQPEDVTPPSDALGSPDEESQPEDVTPPSDAPGSPDEESQPEDVTPPSDAPGSPDEASQPDELVLSGQGTAPVEEDETPVEEAPAPDEEAPAPDEEDVAPVEEPASENVTSPEDDSAAHEPAEADEQVQAGGSEATDPGTPPSQDQLGGTGSPDGPTMSDTATRQTPVPSGEFAGLTLLLLIGAHMAMRRDRLVPSTQD
jgi:hypothetical protein